ncbi:MAG: hypothetical protein JWM43_1992 [Acidobacteriaceae bacterium]|nr:hypothetical protein [Acidobacteriaceae bacterium]
MVYRFQPTRLMTPLVVLCGLCAVSYWLNPEPWHHLSFATQALFAAALIVFAALMLLLRSRMSLRIDERGIEVFYPIGAPRFYAWAEIEAARIIRKRIFLIPVMSSIGLNLREGARPTNAVLRAAGAVNGYNASFPAFFDLSDTEILERIAFYKSQYQHG